MDPATPRVAAITGASSGIGAAAAAALSRLGWRVVVLGHDPARLDRAAAALPEPPLARVVSDLTRLDGMRSAAAAILRQVPRLDLLVNNAGGVFARPEVTPDGHERTFALNVLAPFVLARKLEPALAAAGGARVVNVASEAHRGARLDWGDLDAQQRYRGFRAYSRSKLALILLTSAFARRHPLPGVAALAVHPGVVRSGFGANNAGIFGWVVNTGVRAIGISPDRAAAAIVRAGTDPALAGRTGEYFRRERSSIPSPAARSVADGDRLWGILEGWAGG